MKLHSLIHFFFPPPVEVPAELTDSNSPIVYTDCCEISFLRFTHAVVFDMNSALNSAQQQQAQQKQKQEQHSLHDYSKIDFARLDQLGAADWLRKFFNDHPFVGDRAYFSTTDEGQAERNEWSVLMTRQPSPFVYVRLGKFELEANICNFFALLKVRGLR